MAIRMRNIFRAGLHFTYKSSGILYVATVINLEKTKFRTFVIVEEFCAIKPVVHKGPLDLTASTITDITIIGTSTFREYEKKLLS